MYDQLSLLGSQAATTAPETTPAPATPAGVTYYPIDEATARRSRNDVYARLHPQFRNGQLPRIC